jgi:hypothetical protein
MMPFMMAWIPFLEPMHFMQGAWLMLSIPLVIGIAMVHKALRMPEHASWWSGVAVMTVQSLLGLLALAFVLDAFVLWVIPLI